MNKTKIEVHESVSSDAFQLFIIELTLIIKTNCFELYSFAFYRYVLTFSVHLTDQFGLSLNELMVVTAFSHVILSFIEWEFDVSSHFAEIWS